MNTKILLALVLVILGASTHAVEKRCIDKGIYMYIQPSMRDYNYCYSREDAQAYYKELREFYRLNNDPKDARMIEIIDEFLKNNAKRK